MTRRPTGRVTMRVGFVLLGLGLVAFALQTFGPEILAIDDYSVESWRHAVYLFATQIGPLCLALGMLLWTVGYIVFALSFLPGSEDHAQDR